MPYVFIFHFCTLKNRRVCAVRGRLFEESLAECFDDWILIAKNMFVLCLSTWLLRDSREQMTSNVYVDFTIRHSVLVHDFHLYLIVCYMRPFSFEATKSTKGASKARRDLINSEVANLRDLLPLPSSTRQRLSQLQLMALVCVFVRKSNYFINYFKQSKLNSSDTRLA